MAVLADDSHRRWAMLLKVISIVLGTLLLPRIIEGQVQSQAIFVTQAPRAERVLSASASPLPLSTPEEEGFSKARLARLDDAMVALVRDGDHTGVIVLVARNGRIVDWRAWGLRDLETKLPMEKDTLCRIYSMTKVITSVAALALYEEGRFALNDPVQKYIPELKGMQVFAGGSPESPELVPAKSNITIKHLMTHTSGLIYPFGDSPVEKVWSKANLFEKPYSVTLRDWVARLRELPLASQPGAAWHYGVNSDVLGYLIEVVSGMPFDRFVEKRVLLPLLMSDTHFVLPEEKKSRAAGVYRKRDGQDELVPYPEGMPPLGGMALWSTPGDYARFAQMLLNGGQLDGVRILGRKTVELMTANHLTHTDRPTTTPGGSEGFGLGGAVRIDLARGNSLGSVGSFGWSGAASTWFRIDPKEKLLLLIFQQRMPSEAAIYLRFSNLVYQALVD